MLGFICDYQLVVLHLVSMQITWSQIGKQILVSLEELYEDDKTFDLKVLFCPVLRDTRKSIAFFRGTQASPACPFDELRWFLFLRLLFSSEDLIEKAQIYET
jgi:hypothetical protein